MAAADCLAKGREFGVVWQLDSEVARCPACHAAFNLVNRRHHCRHCGRVYCAACTEYDLEHPKTKKMERACAKCVERAGGPAAGPPIPPPAAAPPAGSEAALYGVPWKPDAEAHACGCCLAPFSTANRKHHCRFCGDVVCLKCSVNQLMHPRTNRPEKACVQCVKQFQVAEAVETWKTSPPTILRAVALGLAVLLLPVGLLSHAPGALLLPLLAAPLLAGHLYLRHRQVTSGTPADEFLVRYYNDIGHIYLVVLAVDGLLLLLAVIMAVATLAGGHGVAGVLLLALTGALGGTAWFSYREAQPALRHTWTQLRGTEEDAEGAP